MHQFDNDDIVEAFVTAVTSAYDPHTSYMSKSTFKNFLITPNVGATFRFFISKWVTVSAGFRDYVFVDQFEAQDRMEVNGDLAKDNADSALINNIVFQLGVSLWIPPTFEYTTFR